MKYSYFLLCDPTLTGRQKIRLVEHMGSAKRVCLGPKEELALSGILTREKFEKFLKERETWDYDKNYNDFLKRGFSFTTMEYEDYPRRLIHVYDRPYGFFYAGKLPEEKERTVAIVGSRRASAYGKWATEELAKELSLHGFVIVSGMARGVDSIAAKGALATGGTTLAVLGCGVDLVYPPENKELYQQIKNKGCVISEYPLQTPPLAAYFPQRNRIISGLSDTVLVMEAKEKSGSLITADYALEQGKDVYALPGRITDPMSKGCNRLIAQGAGIITSPEEFTAGLLEAAGLQHMPDQEIGKAKILLEKEDRLVYSVLDFDPLRVEEIQKECNLHYLIVLEALQHLIELGLAAETFKNQYVRTGRI